MRGLMLGPEQAVDWREGPALEAGWPRTLAGLVADCCVRHGTRPVLVDCGRGWSWLELEAAAGRLAAAWAGRVGPGDRVAIVLGNGVEHLLAELAAWRLGAIAAPLFPGFDAATRAGLLARIEPAVTVERPEQARLDGGAPPPWRELPPAAPCLLLATSGSTGLPRLVTLSQGNLCSQQAAFGQLWPEVGADDRLAAYLPWHHSFGALAERLWALVRGARLHVVPGGGRDRAALRHELAAVRPTVFMSVPRLHRELRLDGGLDLTALRWAFTAGAPIERAERDWYQAAGVPLYEGWGLTECSPSACITPPGAPLVHGVVGQPIPGVGVGLRADGRILVRGPGVMLGYWRDPEASAAVLQDGVLDAGDLGAWEPAGLRLCGRADHTLKLDNGEKVPVAALEAALAALPGVLHAVISVHHGRLAAILELAAPATDPAALLAAFNASQPGHLRIQQAWTTTRALDLADGTLTASNKVVRGRVLERVASGEGIRVVEIRS